MCADQVTEFVTRKRDPLSRSLTWSGSLQSLPGSPAAGGTAFRLDLSSVTRETQERDVAAGKRWQPCVTGFEAVLRLPRAVRMTGGRHCSDLTPSHSPRFK